MGLDHERLTYHHSGRDMRLTDVHGDVIQEILAIGAGSRLLSNADHLAPPLALRARALVRLRPRQNGQSDLLERKRSAGAELLARSFNQLQELRTGA